MTEPYPPVVEQLLTLNDMAVIYRVPASTIRTWSKEGTVPAGFYVGKHLRWDPSAIREDISRRRGAIGSEAHLRESAGA